MWNMKGLMIPVINGVTGIVTKRQKYLETIPGKYSIDFVQKKKAVLWTSYLITKVLQSET